MKKQTSRLILDHDQLESVHLEKHLVKKITKKKQKVYE